MRRDIVFQFFNSQAWFFLLGCTGYKGSFKLFKAHGNEKKTIAKLVVFKKSKQLIALHAALILKVFIIFFMFFCPH